MDEHRFINNLLHFNLEFVAGEMNTYDKLLNEAFEPALDVFLQCPKWHADIELSGMQLEYMEQNFPWMIDKLKILNQRNQIDVICVHYSDTIWPAYPLTDFRKSWGIDKKIMERLGLKFSTTFFSQENFFGEGIAKIKEEFGIKHAVIPEKNYFWPYNRLNPLYPVYDMEGLNLIIRGDTKFEETKWWRFEDKKNDYRIWWTYDKCGDGEPWVGGDPYVNFFRDENKINRKLELYDRELERGTLFTTTNEFVEEIKKLNIEKPKLKPIPEGPWGLEKPGIFQWMGFYFSYYELDVEMRTLGYRSRAILLAAERLLNYISSKIQNNEIKETETPIARYRKMLELGWRYQINGEVSDSSGWVPTLTEMYYSIDRSMLAYYWGKKITKELIKHLGYNENEIYIDTEPIKPLTKNPIIPISKIPSYIKLINSNLFDKKGNLNILKQEELPEIKQFSNIEFFGPEKHIIWRKINGIPGIEESYLLDYQFLHMDVNCGIKIPFTDGKLIYSPSLMDEELVFKAISDYNPKCTHLYLPLPNGLINLGNDWWIIKHNDTAHITSKINLKDHKIEFMALMNLMALAGREQFDIELRQSWRFSLIKASPNVALKYARKINLYPIIPATYKQWHGSTDEPLPWIPITRMVTK